MPASPPADAAAAAGSLRRAAAWLSGGATAAVVAAPSPFRRRRRRRCSTSPTTRRASSTANTTRPSTRTGRPRATPPLDIQASHGGSGAQARAVIDGLDGAGRDPRARQRHRRHRGQVRQDPRRLADEAAAQLRALHLDHRLPGARGEPEGHRGLGRPRRAKASRSSRPTRRPRAARAGTTSPPGPGPTRSSAATRTQIRDYMHKLFAHVPVLDTGARGSTTTFAQRGIGDVLLAWENEAYLALKELGEDQFDIVEPVHLDPRRADGGAGRRQHHLRRAGRGRQGLPRLPLQPRGPGHRAEATSTAPGTSAPPTPPTSPASPELELVTIADFGGWAKVQPEHFGDGGIFDQIYTREVTP